MNSWSEWGTWEERGLRREVFFFPSRGVELYGSLAVASEPTRGRGIVACNSWGVEADRCEPLLRTVALDFARRGGAGIVFHYPGYGDSHGDLAGAGLADLAGAASDAVAEAARRCPGLDWTLAGFMLGAAVASLAQRDCEADRLLLVQPSLLPGAYFQRLSRRREPLVVGWGNGEGMSAGREDGMAYGYPLPQRILASPAAADAAVVSALAGFQGPGAAIHHSEPNLSQEDGWGAIPERFERIDVPGHWRFGTRSNPRLAEAAGAWLDRDTQGVAA